MSERGPFDRLRLDTGLGDTAQFCRHGGQVLGWQARSAGRDLLYLSARSLYADEAAIRGGVPVVFPQFSNFGPLPKHGLARNRAWRLVDTSSADKATLELVDDEATRAHWPHAFAARLDIALGADTLSIELTVENPGAAPLSFTAALHTYLAVQDLAEVRVRGLAGRRYLDATRGLRADEEMGECIAFDGELDRVYPAVAGDIVLTDGDARITVERQGFADAVIWNPGAAKAAALADLGDGDFRRFVCIEPAVFDPPVTLEPGHRWRGKQVLRYSSPAR